MPANPAPPSHAPRLSTGIVVGALGIVFGDIGTSPIYTMATVLDPDQTDGPIEPADAAAHFKLPVDRTVIIGARLEV